MIHGKTDKKPFRKLSYCEFDCNWYDFAFLTNVQGTWQVSALIPMTSLGQAMNFLFNHFEVDHSVDCLIFTNHFFVYLKSNLKQI